MALRYIISYASPIIISDFLYSITGTMPYSTAVGQSSTGTQPVSATALNAQDTEVTGSIAGPPFAGFNIVFLGLGVPTIVHNYSGNTIVIWPPVNGQINRLGILPSNSDPSQQFCYQMVDGSSMEFHNLSPTQWYSTSP